MRVAILASGLCEGLSWYLAEICLVSLVVVDELSN